MNIRKLFVAAVSATLAMSALLQAQQPKESEEPPQYPKTGVRFVICSTERTRMPSPLYAKVGKDFMPYRISAKMPSERVVPDGEGKVKFYETKPEITKDARKVTEKPYLEISIPSEYGSGKSICIIVPGANPASPLTFFLKESDFPLGGCYFINFSPSPLEILTSPTGDLPEHGDKIAPYRRKENNGISRGDANIWAYGAKGHSTEPTSYVLNAPAITPGGEPLRIRASRLTPQRDLSQIQVVVQHPTRANVYKLLSIQFNNESDKRRTITPPAGPNQ